MFRMPARGEVSRIILILAAVAYVFVATLVLARFIVGDLWLVGFWIPLLPLVIGAGWYGLRPITAVAAFIALSLVQYVAVTIATGETFSGGAQFPAWYTPVLTVLIFGGFICILNLVPMAFVFMIALVLRNRLR